MTDDRSLSRRSFIAGSTLLVTGAVGAAAYSQATVTRTADVTVVQDDAADAQLQLAPGPAEGVELSNGQLQFTGQTGGLHVTPTATYRFGSDTNPTSTYAFSVTNQLSEERGVVVGITEDAFDGGALGIEFYDSAGNFLDAATTAADEQAGFTLAAGQTVYTRVVIATSQTTGTMTGTVTFTSDADTSIAGTGTQSTQQGTIETTETSPVAGATVRAISPDGVVLASDTSTEDGSYSLDVTNPPDGTVVVARVDNATDTSSAGTQLYGAAERVARFGSDAPPVDFTFTDTTWIAPEGDTIGVLQSIEEPTTKTGVTDIGTVEGLEAMRTGTPGGAYRLVENIDASKTQRDTWNPTSGPAEESTGEIVNDPAAPTIIETVHGTVASGSITVTSVATPSTATPSDVTVTVTDATTGTFEAYIDDASIDTLAFTYTYDVADPVTGLGTFDAGTAFTGELDGRGHTVTGVDVTRPVDSGVFRALAGEATVENLEFDGPIATGGQASGVIASRGSGSGAGITIRNITIRNAVVNGGASIGAVIGELTGGTIESVHVSGGTIGGASTPSRAGGVVGALTGDATVRETPVDDGARVEGGATAGGVAGVVSGSTVEQAVSDAGVAGASDGTVGGVAGSVESGGTVRESVATETSSVESGDTVGGVAGAVTDGTVTDTVTGSDVTGTASTSGGVAGRVETGGEVTDTAYWDTSSSGTGETAGVGENTGSFNGTGSTTDAMQGSDATTDGDLTGLDADAIATQSGGYPLPSTTTSDVGSFTPSSAGDAVDASQATGISESWTRPAVNLGSIKAVAYNDVDSIVYLAGGQRVTAVDAATGASLWTDQSSDAVRDVEAAPDGSLVAVTYAAGGDWYTRALDAVTGSEEWRNSTNVIPTGFAPDSATVYGGNGMEVFAIDASDGSYKWGTNPFSDNPKDIETAPDGSIAVAGDGGSVAVLNPDGTTRWSDDGGSKSGFGGGIAVTCSTDSATVYAAQDGTVAYDAATGDVTWSTNATPVAVDVMSHDGTVYVLSDDAITATDASTAASDAVLWSVSPDIVTSFHGGRITPDGETLYLGQESNTQYGVLAFNTVTQHTGESPRYQYQNARLHRDTFGPSVIAPDRSAVYTTGDDGTIASVEPGTGKVNWRVDTIQNGVVTDLAVGPSGATVYAAIQNHGVQALAASDGTEQWRATSTVTAPKAVTVGRDAVYAAGAGGVFAAFDPASGTRSWVNSSRHSSTVTHITVTPDSSIVITATSSGTVAGANAADGGGGWVSDVFSNAVSDVTVNPAGGHVYAVENSTGVVVALTASTGDIDASPPYTWTAAPYGGAVSDPVLETAPGGGDVYTAGGGIVAGIDASTGSVQWTDGTHTGSVTSIDVSPDGSVVMTGSSDGRVLGSAASDGSVVWDVTGPFGGVSLPVLYFDPVIGDVVYVFTPGYRAWKFSLDGV